MTLVVTDAVVLHAFDYLESSRIFRLATREAGVQSVIARGARRSRSRYGSALDLFAGGVASIQTREGRELQTLSSFEVTKPRTSIAASLERFTAASALAELMLRFAADDTQAELFETLATALDAVGAAAPDATCDVALGAAWHIVSELGFAPTVDACATCHTMVPPADAARFSHPAGGVLCARCVASVPSSRTIPSTARDALRTWLGGDDVSLDDEGSRRAHQRLLREFLQEHLADGRPLVAYDVWERDGWAAPVAQRTERA